jgi:hypothetical protein
MIRGTRRFSNLLTLMGLLTSDHVQTTAAFVTARTGQPVIFSRRSAIRMDEYEEAFKIIDHAAETGQLSPELDKAVRFIEVNSYKIYPATDPSNAEELWKSAQGSWKLTASTGSHKSRTFHAPPWFLPFSFAVIDGTRFGNGIGLSENQIGLSLLHHAHFHVEHRKLSVTHPDMYFGGNPVGLPEWLRPSIMKVVEEDNNSDHPQKRTPTTERTKKVPTFVLVGASEKALIARGNQSGGLALWTRLPRDLRPVAFNNPSERAAMPPPDSNRHLLPQ